MKKNLLKIIGAAMAVFGICMAPVYPLFDVVVVKKHKRDAAGKKRFRISHIKKNHPRNGYEAQYEAGKAWCGRQEMQDCHIRSKDGLLLHASYFPADEPRRMVLLSHGYRGSGFGDFANIIEFLHRNHCSLLIIDQRCCGKSEGKYITFGAKEQNDILRWSHYLAGLDKDALPIYLYGKSLGASAVLMASAHLLPDRVRGIIADSAFCSMKTQMKNMACNWFHLHWNSLLLLRLNIFCRVIAGFRMADADTALSLQRNRRPALFFHGLEDTFVVPENSRYHDAKCRAPKELVLIPGAKHLCGEYAAPQLYRAKLMEFFEKYD